MVQTTSEPMMPMGMSRCGLLRFLRGGGDGVEADVREEDDAGGAHDAAPAEFAEGAGVRRDEGHVVLGLDVGVADSDDDDDDGDLDDDDRRR